MSRLATPKNALRIMRATKFASLALILAFVACGKNVENAAEPSVEYQSENVAKADRGESKSRDFRDELERVESAKADFEDGLVENTEMVTLSGFSSNEAHGGAANAGRNAHDDPAAPITGHSFRDGASGQGRPGATPPESAELADKDSSATKESSAKRVETWKPAKAVANAARLSVGTNDDLDSKGMQISVAIDGWRARVVVDTYFLNPRDRDLEGTFKLRLPDGASPYYFAFGQTVFGEAGGKEDPDQKPVYFTVNEQGEMKMDAEDIGNTRSRTWQKVRESRMVPKEKAAHAYTETTRRRIDPALMEWNGGGVFSARVFPLQAKQLHRIVIGYDVDLTQAGNDLVLGINVPEGLPTSRVDVGVHESLGALKYETSIEPTTVTKPEGLGKRQREFLAWQNPAAGEIQVRIKDAGVISLDGQMAGRGHYRAARFKLAIDDKGVTGTKSNALFLLDTSASSNPEKFNVWLALMKNHLEENRDLLTTFNVLFFNVEQWMYKAEPLTNTKENVEALLAFCDTLILEGATDIAGALSKAVSPNGMGGNRQALASRLFLLSDGAATWGEADRDAMLAIAKSAAPLGLFAFRTGMSGSDSATLNHLAIGTGGAVFAVSGAEQVVEASRGFRRRPWKILSVDHRLGENEMLEGRPTHVYPGQELKLVCDAIEAKIEGQPTITLKLDRDGEVTTLTFPITHSVSSHIAARVYGQVATGQLEDLVQFTEDKAQAFARHFRITGRTCSLLMLESEEDYLRYDIKPENDAFVVTNSKVQDLIANAEAEIGERRGDPKVAFNYWIKKFENMPGVGFSMSPALKLLIEKLPADAFRVAQEELECSVHGKSDVPAVYLERLQKQSLNYELSVKEAKRRAEKGNTHDQLKALSSLVEENPGDQVLAREVAFYAQEAGFGGQAYHLLQRVRDSRPWEAVTYHAMAKALRQSGKDELALLYYEISMAGQWPARFGEFKRIVAMDYQGFLKDLKGRATGIVKEYVGERDREVSTQAGLSEADILITMTWNTDSTDIDLHVIEPNGEDCHYAHRNTKNGGRMTADVTEGFGPEMYTIVSAKRGEYRVRAHYYGNNSNRSGVATKIEVTVHRNFGRDGHTQSTQIIELNGGEKMLDITSLTFK